jgi:hypothetical protein
MMRKILVFAAAAALVFGLSAPSWAVADFGIGGNVQLETSWHFDDVGDRDDTTSTGTPVPAGTGFDDTTDYESFMLGTSRINFKATVGDVTGFYELGIGSGAGITTRLAWAEWDAGSFLLKVGRDWGVVAFGFSDQQLAGGNANIGYGCLYDDRNDGLWITVPGEMFTFVGEINQARGQGDPTGAAVDTEAAIPRLAAKMTFQPTEMLTFTPSAGFQTYELLAPPGGVPDYDGEDITTWAVALDGRVDLESFYFGYEFWYGENLGSGGYVLQPLTGAQTNAVSGRLEDIPAYGGFVRMVWPLETVQFMAGVGAEVVDWDDLDLDLAFPTANEDDNTRWSGYVAVIYNFSDNFWMQPEISYFDQGNNQRDVDLGNDIYVGVHWQADF